MRNQDRIAGALVTLHGPGPATDPGWHAAAGHLLSGYASIQSVACTVVLDVASLATDPYHLANRYGPRHQG